jgi:hypothetical protein
VRVTTDHHDACARPERVELSGGELAHEPPELATGSRYDRCGSVSGVW